MANGVDCALGCNVMGIRVLSNTKTPEKPYGGSGVVSYYYIRTYDTIGAGLAYVTRLFDSVAPDVSVAKKTGSYCASPPVNRSMPRKSDPVIEGDPPVDVLSTIVDVRVSPCTGAVIPLNNT